jgi:hypothetical protein
MSFSKNLPLISLLAASFSTFAVAQVTIDPSAMTAMPKLMPGTVAALNPPCTRVDLGISSVRIDKLEGGNYSATYEIRSFGPDAWKSSPSQAGSIITTAATSKRNASSLDTPITLVGGAGAVQTITSGRYGVDYARRGSRQEVKYTLDIAITFDPDILNDGNTCNDDAQVQNNSFYLGSKLDEFLYRSRERSMTFTFADRQGPLPMSERTLSR